MVAMRLLAFATLVLCVAAGPVSAAASSGASHGPAACGRTCLYGVLDQYLAALKAKSSDRAPLAKGVHITENNVALKIGDGLWGTITGLGDYDLRFADVKAGAVGFYGVVDESGTASPFALRLTIRGGKITEVESVVVRAADSGVPFVNANLVPKPVLNEIVPPAQRSSRARMIALAEGYFDTLQRNDGKLHTAFDDACNRRENGMQTTNNPDGAAKYGFIMGLGCADQFKLGFYRFDDRLRSRRVLVVDTERGLVMLAGFIDHSGRLGEYTLTDGRKVIANIHRPHSFVLLETFKIRGGRIQQVEADFTTVPYRMPSPWLAAGFHYE
jgi:hypothetical protein